MAHPFFDTLVWPASRDDARAFLRALEVTFPTKELINPIYTEVAPDLAVLNLGQAPALIWTEALGNLVRTGHLRDFFALLPKKSQNAEFLGRLDAVVNATSAIERRVLPNGTLVVDRASLRAQIALLLAKDSIVTVLLVRGGPKSGKTWGRWLFDAAAREAGGEPVSVGQDIVFTLEEVIQVLFAQVDGVPGQLADAVADPTKRPTTPDAWYRLICNQLLEAANKADKVLWIAVDDLGVDEQSQPLIDDEILQFFNQFGLMMSAAQYQARFRLMLIHYPETTPTRWSSVIFKADRAVAEDIREEAIVDFLRGWSQERGKVIVEEQLTTLSKELIAGLDAPPPAPEPGVAAPATPEAPRLQRLFELVTAMTQKLDQA